MATEFSLDLGGDLLSSRDVAMNLIRSCLVCEVRGDIILVSQKGLWFLSTEFLITFILQKLLSTVAFLTGRANSDNTASSNK
jgi:hypothetical protein